MACLLTVKNMIMVVILMTNLIDVCMFYIAWPLNFHLKPWDRGSVFYKQVHMHLIKCPGGVEGFRCLGEWLGLRKL